MKASFLQEMTSLEESVAMKRASKYIETLEDIAEETLFTEGVGNNFAKFPMTLLAEIMYTRNGMDAGTDRDAKEILKTDSEFDRVENFKAFAANADSLYFIDKETANGKEEKYIYDSQTKVCYKIEASNFGGHLFHSLTWYNIVLNGDKSFVEGGVVMGSEMTGVTTTDADGNTITTYACEPNMTGFTASKTYMAYYSPTGDVKLKSLSDYIAEGKPRTDGAYVLYDFANKMWPNIKCVGRNEKGIEMETWWTWLPRYAYKLTNITGETATDAKNAKSDVVFITQGDKVQTGENTYVELTDEAYKDYTVHSAFNQGGKQLAGLWVAKYPVSKNDSSEKSIAPDYNQFADATTKVLAFDSGGRFYVEIGLDKYKEIFPDTEETDYAVRKVKVQTTDGGAIIKGSVSTLGKFATNNNITEDGLGTNLTNVTQVVNSSEAEGEEFYIYDYNKKLWANCKTVNAGKTSYWVWIPRYAYSLKDNNTEIIFVDTDDMPVDGNEIYALPSRYTVHSAFNQNNTKLKGIWVAKYPVSKDEYAKVDTTNFAKPDLSDATITADINAADQVSVTYYSEDGRRTTSTTYYEASIPNLKDASGNYSVDKLPLTKTANNNYGVGVKYDLYRYDLGLPFTISIRNKSEKSTKTYTWWPRYADKGNERIYLTESATAPTGYTIGADFKDNTIKGIWKK